MTNTHTEASRRAPVETMELGKSPVRKRSIVVDGKKTSVSLEDAFWDAFKGICGEAGKTMSQMVTGIAGEGPSGNLSSTIRVYVLHYFIARNVRPARAA